VSLSNHERWARPSAFAKATAESRSAKRGGWSTGSGRAVLRFKCSPGTAPADAKRTRRTRFLPTEIIASIAVIATRAALSVVRVVDNMDSMKLGVSILDVERELQWPG